MEKFNFYVLKGSCFFFFPHKRCLSLFEVCSYISREKIKNPEGTCTHLHDAIPVVPRWHPEEGEEGHAEVGESCMPAQTFARIFFTAVCRRKKWKHVSKAKLGSSPSELHPWSAAAGRMAAWWSHGGLVQPHSSWCRQMRKWMVTQCGLRGPGWH